MHKHIQQFLIIVVVIAFFIIPIHSKASSTTFLIEGETQSLSEQQVEYLPNVNLSIVTTNVETKSALSTTTTIYEDSKRTIFQSFSLPDYDKKWHIYQFGYNKAWAYEPIQSAKIALIDTGVSSELLQHPHFQKGQNFVTPGLLPIDDNGHGTALASIILDVIGPYPVQIIPIKAADQTGSFTVSNIVKAIDYAIEQQADIINLSFGAKNPNEAEQQAINKAVEAGLVVFSSSGNTGRKEYYYPAAYPNVFSVGAINSDLSRAPFSTYNDQLDLVAPGTNLYVLRHDQKSTYTTIEGTSFSAAYVTGQYALLKVNSLHLTADQLPKLATDLGPVNYDIEYGYGMIETDQALAKIRGKAWHTVTTAERQKKWTIRLTKPVNATQPFQQYIKIYNNLLVEQPIQIRITTDHTIEVSPTAALLPGEYWLTIDANLQSKNGRKLKQPALVKFIVQ